MRGSGVGDSEGMRRTPSLEKRPGREVAHNRDVSAQDTEAILGWQSAAGRVGAIASSILIHAER